MTLDRSPELQDAGGFVLVKLTQPAFEGLSEAGAGHPRGELGATAVEGEPNPVSVDVNLRRTFNPNDQIPVRHVSIPVQSRGGLSFVEGRRVKGSGDEPLGAFDKRHKGLGISTGFCRVLTGARP